MGVFNIPRRASMRNKQTNRKNIGNAFNLCYQLQFNFGGLTKVTGYSNSMLVNRTKIDENLFECKMSIFPVDLPSMLRSASASKFILLSCLRCGAINLVLDMTTEIKNILLIQLFEPMLEYFHVKHQKCRSGKFVINIISCQQHLLILQKNNNKIHLTLSFL